MGLAGVSLAGRERMMDPDALAEMLCVSTDFTI
jgi:hypothetical protein